MQDLWDDDMWLRQQHDFVLGLYLSAKSCTCRRLKRAVFRAAVLGCSASLGAFYALHKRYRQGVAHSRTLCPPPVDPKAICEAHD